MAFSANIDDLMKLNPEARDVEWEKAFLQGFPAVNLEILSETPVAGPDGWPYLMVAINPEGTESSQKVLSWLSDKGIGLVVNPQKDTPDFAFSFGMIWNYRENGEFETSLDKPLIGQIKMEPGQKVLAGPPSDKYLPEYARTVLRAFFRDNGISDMKILVMSQDNKHFDLCFSLEAFGSPPAHEHRGILEAISWFLPGHYSLMIVSEAGLPQFHKL